MKIKIKEGRSSGFYHQEEKTPIEHVLFNRGVEDFEDFFEFDAEKCLQDPYNLNYIREAVEKVDYHLKSSKKIAVIVDADCDGFTSAATLSNYLYLLFEEAGLYPEPRAEIVYLFHEDKSHGLSDTKIMKKLRDEIKPELLIIPDASGTQEQYDALTALGIDIVVLDHHETAEQGDGDKVIVVNCQHSPNYQNKAYSGAGVVWSFCRVMDDFHGTENLSTVLVDLVAVGLVADVMDLKSKETRFIIKFGLLPENLRNPLIEYFVFANDYQIQGKLNPTKVAFNIAPLFNAVIRIGTLEEKEFLFNSLLFENIGKTVLSGNRNKKGQLVPLVEEAYRLISNAKARQTRRQNKLMEMIENVIQKENLYEHKVLLITIGLEDYEEEYRALAGLVCNKLQDAYQRPVMIVFENENGTYSGSMRSPEGIEAFADFRGQCEESGLFVYASGHSLAAGVSFLPDQEKNILTYFNRKYANINVEYTYECDYAFSSIDQEAPDVIYNLVQYSDIWGQGLKEPLIAFVGVLATADALQLVGVQKGKPTLKIKMENGVVAIKFFSSQEEYNILRDGLNEDGTQCYTLTIVGRPSINEFRGETTPQIFIEDYEIVGTVYDF